MAQLRASSPCEASEGPPEKRQRLGDENSGPNLLAQACPQLTPEQLARIERNRAAALERRRQSAASAQSEQPEPAVVPAASAASPAAVAAAVAVVPTPSTCGPAAPGGVVLTAEQRSQIEQRRLAAMERRRALTEAAATPAPKGEVQAEHVAPPAAPDPSAEASVSAKEPCAPEEAVAPMSPAPSAPPSPAASSCASETSLLAGSAAPSSPVGSAPSSPESVQVSEDGDARSDLDGEDASCSSSCSSSSSTSSSDEDGDGSESGDGGDAEEEIGSQASPDVEGERQSCDERDIDGTAPQDLPSSSADLACAPAPISPRDAICGCATCTAPPSVAVPPPKPIETRTAKQALVAQLLCRWWYVLPEWPPADYNWESALAKHRLRRVPVLRFDEEPEIDERGFTKVYELSQWKGQFRAIGDRLHDLRPVAGRPSYDQLMQKNTPELHRLLVAAYTEQLAELERQPAKGASEEELKQVLRQKLKEVKQKASFSLMFAPKAAADAKE